MTKPLLTAIVLTAAIAIAGKHFDEEEILVVDTDIDLDTANQLLRLGRAQPSAARKSRRAVEQEPPHG